MDLNLHAKQAINHLERVLGYYPFVQEDGAATVWLTHEDWHVVADLLFNMGDPTDLLPEAILEYGLTEDQRAILIRTDDCEVRIEPT